MHIYNYKAPILNGLLVKAYIPIRKYYGGKYIIDAVYTLSIYCDIYYGIAKYYDSICYILL